jgi:hypothetical protein
MSIIYDPLEVTVAGGSAEVNTLVYGVVQNALDEAGFTDIAVSSPHGDVSVDTAQVPSLLDIIRAKNPSMFDTPIRVCQVAPADAVANMANGDSISAAIANTVYSGALDEAVVEEVAAVYIEGDDSGEEVPGDDIPF